MNSSQPDLVVESTKLASGCLANFLRRRPVDNSLDELFVTLFEERVFFGDVLPLITTKFRLRIAGGLGFDVVTDMVIWIEK